VASHWARLASRALFLCLEFLGTGLGEPVSIRSSTPLLVYTLMSNYHICWCMAHFFPYLKMVTKIAVHLILQEVTMKMRHINNFTLLITYGRLG
jgi:hypothetical protein